MQSAHLPANETQRLAAVQNAELLGTAPEATFDAIAGIAAYLCDAPIGIVSVIDETRQWFKAHHGLVDLTSTPREHSFCAHAILQSDIFEVSDAAADVRFADNPLVTGYPMIRFYAGFPLRDAAGLAIGTLCVIDRHARRLTERHQLRLRELARSTADLIAVRIRPSDRERQQRGLAANHEARRQLALHTERLNALVAGLRCEPSGPIATR